MTVFEKIKSMSKEEFAAWLDKYGSYDGSSWQKWWDENYCSKCATVFGTADFWKQDNAKNKQVPFAWCELHDGKCKFFPNHTKVPDSEETILMWLSSDEGGVDIGKGSRY